MAAPDIAMIKVAAPNMAQNVIDRAKQVVDLGSYSVYSRIMHESTCTSISNIPLWSVVPLISKIT